MLKIASPIRRLPPHLVNQIAAGEVIERPAAALRELLQNSLDAGATQITVTLESAGHSMIRVRDDGHGMNREQLSLALERHATSKLPEDRLDQIQSFGFRGEALPSIASVSHLTLQSRSAEEETGWQIISDYGVSQTAKPIAMAPGTSIIVRDLFVNTPARLKFQKSQRSELMAMRGVVTQTALSHPQCRFYLSNDGKIILDFPACLERTARLAQVWGRAMAGQFIPLQAERGAMSLSGALLPPHINNPTRAKQVFLVNNRPVTDKVLQQALYLGYRDVMPKGRQAIACLALDVPAGEVDVNVHPAKSEVRFLKAQEVRGFLISAIQHALAAQGVKPVANFNVAQSLVSVTAMPSPQPPSGFASPLRATAPQKLFPTETSIRYAMAEAAPLEMPKEEQVSEQPLGQAVMQLFDTYIVAVNDAGLVLVDQHAAHERLVYEQLKTILAARTKQPAQELLLPIVVELAAGESEALLAQSEELARLGLKVDSFGENAVALRAVPSLLGDKVDGVALVQDLASLATEAKSGADFLERHLHEVCASMACYGSVRAGRRLEKSEMNALLRDVETTPNAWQCNHGRPTVMQLDQGALERLFKRG